MKGSPAALAEAVSRFLTLAQQEGKTVSQQALNKFVRWFGNLTPVNALTGHDVATFGESEAPSNPDWQRNLESVRSFLAWCKQQGITDTNLAVHIKMRKPSTRKGSRRQAREMPAVHLTREGFSKLQTELADLISQRPHIADELRRAAADKDFRENAPYEAARDHQGRVEARIRELETTLKSAAIIEEGISFENQFGGELRIVIGSSVLLHDLTDGEEVRYTLVGPDEANPRQGKISVASPTGKALLDRTEGEELEVVAPAGTVRYRVLKIEG